MNASNTVKELAAAMAKARPLIEGAKKDKNNPAFKSKYADLSSVSEAIAGPIAQHGLSYVQVSHDRENAAVIETIILHSSGEWMGCGPVAVPVVKHDAHGYGSALTYARRYSLSAAFGVVPEDDDGNAAAKSAPTRIANPLTEMKEEAFNALPADEQEFLRKIAADVTALITEDRSDDAHGFLENQNLAMEEKLALWFLLGSKERTALKKAGANAELAKRATARANNHVGAPASVPQ